MLQDQEKMLKLLNRIEKYIELTPAKQLAHDSPSNLAGLTNIYINFAAITLAEKKNNVAFWQKLENMIESDLKNKSWRMQIDDIMPMLNAMAIMKCRNENILTLLLNDLDFQIEQGMANNL